MSGVFSWRNGSDLELFQKNLESRVGRRRKLKLRINDNRTTMLSVKWDPGITHVSLHRMFLQAPQNVLEELVSYIQDEKSTACTAIREYINLSLKQYDYSDRIDPTRLQSKGKVYDLQELYDDVNREYFDSQLDLSITWFGRPSRRRRNTMTFGLYQDSTKLVKIHRTLDSWRYPHFFVSFIVYHEMLHHVCPSYYDENGRHQIHSKEFKVKEKEFRYFELAQQWMKKNHSTFFNTYF